MCIRDRATTVDIARPGGTVVLAGTRGSDATPGFRPDNIVYKELRILGALGVDVTAYRAALDLLASDRHPFRDLPRRVVGFDGLEDLLRSMAGESPVGSDRPVHGVLVPSRSGPVPDPSTPTADMATTTTMTNTTTTTNTSPTTTGANP